MALVNRGYLHSTDFNPLPLMPILGPYNLAVKKVVGGLEKKKLC